MKKATRTETRTAGVLCNISSLPGPYGIGVFGQEAKDFLDMLGEMRFRWWQVLPFSPLDSMNSPYTSPSAFAGNILYIDPRDLLRRGLITEQEEASNRWDGTPYTAAYDFAKERRLSLLRTAFSRAGSALREEVAVFAREREWLPDFSLYMAVKEANGQKPWWEWPDECADYARCRENAAAYAAETAFWDFTQYLFFTEWEEIHRYARQRGIGVLGDMPVYVALDSADVWAHTGLFQIDPATRRPSKVAGVPPDYFSQDGQLWGNPLYDWDAMKRDGYRWWVGRIGAALGIYDRVRIDHFRGLASYWAVPAGAKTAKEGAWEQGPGQALFDAMEAAYPDPAIVAEDLGVFGDDVTALLESTGFPGMRVVQFGFDPNGDSTHLPHNYPFHCLAYIGTHDNNTLLGWLWEAKPEERAFALRYCGFEGDNWGQGGYYSPSCRKIIETVWRSVAHTAVIAFQDLCGFGSDARMNIPGVPESNWRVRAAKETLDGIDKAYFREINRLYRRDGENVFLSPAQPPSAKQE